MKKLKTPALLFSAIMGLSISSFDRDPVNLKTINQIFNRFDKASLSRIDYPKIAYEKDFYKDYFREELKGSSYLRSETQNFIPFHKLLDSLANEAVKFNRSYNNNPRKSGMAYLKDINNDGNVGVGKRSGYYFSLF